MVPIICGLFTVVAIVIVMLWVVYVEEECAHI